MVLSAKRSNSKILSFELEVQLGVNHRLVYARNNPPSHNLLVLVPILAILAGALDVVPSVTVDEEDSEVHDIEVGNKHAPTLGFALNHLSAIGHDKGLFSRRRASGKDLVSSETCRQAVWPCLDPIAKVIDVAGNTPPTCGEKLAASLGLNVFEMSNAWVAGVGAEDILLAVGGSKDEETKTDERAGDEKPNGAERARINRQVPSLKGVDERDPDKVSE